MRVIEEILKEVALDTLGTKHYGRGVKSYSNIESDAYPRIWVHLVNPIDTLHMNGLISTSYEIIGEVSTTISFDEDIANNPDSSSKYLKLLEDMQLLFYRFVGNLNKDSRNKTAIGRVSRKEILHEYDDNVVGYVFNFTMSVHEKISYQC